jgi:7-keto-8-aminopelargonate synthetase-like enzyme
MSVTSALLAHGFHAQGIRFPSVPRGTERLRLTPMATHSNAEIHSIAAALIDVVGETRATS